jgi:multiple sugar transport system permease protein
MRIKRLALFIVLLVSALAMLFPFYWSFLTSVTPGASVGKAPNWLPEALDFSAYAQLFEQLDFWRIIGNSVFIAALTTVFQISTGSLAAYAFSRLTFRFKNTIFLVYLATLMIPFQVLIVPLFIELRFLGLINTYWAVLLPTIASAFGIFLMRQAMNQIPLQLDEAARIDGAGHLRIFSSVLMPNMGPAIATFAVFSFMGSWNSFLWPLVVLRSAEMQTLPVALARLQGQYTTAWDVLMAGSVVSIIPMLIIYIFAQRYVVQGIANSGIK